MERKHDKVEATESSYIPNTALGKRLVAIRARMEASGTPLLDRDEIEREVAARRGGSQA